MDPNPSFNILLEMYRELKERNKELEATLERKSRENQYFFDKNREEIEQLKIALADANNKLKRMTEDEYHKKIVGLKNEFTEKERVMNDRIVELEKIIESFTDESNEEKLEMISYAKHRTIVNTLNAQNETLKAALENHGGPIPAGCTSWYNVPPSRAMGQEELIRTLLEANEELTIDNGDMDEELQERCVELQNEYEALVVRHRDVLKELNIMRDLLIQKDIQINELLENVEFVIDETSSDDEDD